MKASDRFFQYAGIICIPVYIGFTFLSHLYDKGLDPLHNWLSDYGNPLLNPGGYRFYHIGCVVVALLLAIFYIGLRRWYRGHAVARKIVISYVIAQISGIAASVFLILTVVFPLGTHTEIHSAFSTLNMIGMDFFLDFTAIAFWMNGRMPKWIGAWGVSAAIFNIVTMNAFSELYLSEWIFFLLFMGYVALIFLYEKRLLPSAVPGTAPEAEGSHLQQ